MNTPSQIKRRIKRYRTQIQLLYNYLISKSYIVKEETIKIEYNYFDYPSIRNLIKRYDNKNKNLTDYQIDLIQNNFFKVKRFEYNPINYNVKVKIEFNDLNICNLNLEANLNIYYLIFSQLNKIAETQIKEEIINKMVNDRINEIITFKEILIEKL
jgi:hypothetical protein